MQHKLKRYFSPLQSKFWHNKGIFLHKNCLPLLFFDSWKANSSFVKAQAYVFHVLLFSRLSILLLWKIYLWAWQNAGIPCYDICVYFGKEAISLAFNESQFALYSLSLLSSADNTITNHRNWKETFRIGWVHQEKKKRIWFVLFKGKKEIYGVYVQVRILSTSSRLTTIWLFNRK